jgi:DDE superfamily endonuclease
MLADQTFHSADVDLSPFGSLTQRQAALPSAAQRFAPLLFVSNTLGWASGVSSTETAMARAEYRVSRCSRRLSGTAQLKRTAAFSRRGGSTLRPTWQARQLPSGGFAVDFQSPCELADRLSFVSAPELGRGSRTVERRSAFLRMLRQDQARDLEQIRSACEADIERGVVLMNAGYGAETTLRKGVTAFELSYVAGILPNTSVWPPGIRSLSPKKWPGNGRPTKFDAARRQAQACSVKELTLGLPKETWRNVKWHESSADFLTSRFARLRGRPSHRDCWLSERHAEERPLIEWPDDESEPTKMLWAGRPPA